MQTKIYKLFIRIILLGSVTTLLSVTAAFGQEQGYTIPWWTVDSGGAALNTGGYTLAGTAGQSDAGVLGGGDYTLTGGFWAYDEVGAATEGHTIYLPLILRSNG